MVGLLSQPCLISCQRWHITHPISKRKIVRYLMPHPLPISTENTYNKLVIISHWCGVKCAVLLNVWYDHWLSPLRHLGELDWIWFELVRPKEGRRSSYQILSMTPHFTPNKFGIHSSLLYECYFIYSTSRLCWLGISIHF